MMNDKITVEEVAPRFVGMPAAQRQLLLAIYAHELTIVARDRFLQRDFQSASQCNEALHRLVGYMAKLLRNPHLVESSLIDMLVEGAVQTGSSDSLRRSIELAGY